MDNKFRNFTAEHI